jgi:hypothetical protein
MGESASVPRLCPGFGTSSLGHSARRRLGRRGSSGFTNAAADVGVGRPGAAVEILLVRIARTSTASSRPALAPLAGLQHPRRPGRRRSRGLGPTAVPTADNRGRPARAPPGGSATVADCVWICISLQVRETVRGTSSQMGATARGAADGENELSDGGKTGAVRMAKARGGRLRLARLNPTTIEFSVRYERLH